MINANAIALEAMAKAEAKIPPQPRRQGPPPPPQHCQVDPYAGNTVYSGAVKVVALEDFKETKAKPGDNQWSSWRGYLDSISLERVEKPLKRFMAMFQMPPPPTPPPRGHVDPNNTLANLTARASEAEARVANRARIKALGKGGVYRAATGTWEEFKDAQVKEGPPVDDEA